MEAIQKNPDLKKHLGTVQISNPLTLIQRKAFSLLLFNAYSEIAEAKGKTHEISIKDLQGLLGFNSKNFSALYEEIEKLQFTKIQYINNPKSFGTLSFFSFTGRENGKFLYSFAPELEKKLYHPDLYAQINVLALREFESRYTIALYENLARYRPNRKAGYVGGSPKWSVDEFREIMGVSDSELYKQFKFFNSKIIAPSLKEINAKSDLIVSLERIKSGRSIVALKFHIDENPQPSLGLIPQPLTVEIEAKKPLAQKMTKLYGVESMQAGKWLMDYGDTRFEEVLEITAEAIQGGQVKRPVGFIAKAFSQNYQKAPKGEDVKKALKAEEQKKKQEAEAKKRAEEEAKKAEQEAEKQREIERVNEYMRSLSQNEKIALYTEFYHDTEGAWFGKVLPFEKGENPNLCGNDQIKVWFFDFIAEQKIQS